MSEGATTLDRFQLLADTGFEGVDVLAPGELALAELRDASAATGVAIAHGLATRSLLWPLSHPDADVRAFGLEGLLIGLRDAATLGASSLLVPALLPVGVAPAEGRDLSQAELRKALPVAEEVGVRIAIENVWDGFLPTSGDLADYVDELGSPMAVVHFDVGNAVPGGEPERWIDELGDRIHKVDLKSFSRALADREGLARGFEVDLLEGDCDWAPVVEALNRIGYRGWASVELPGSGRARLESAAEAIERVFADRA
jgi:L-ribulose-5-phosphate 3-epimerase